MKTQALIRKIAAALLLALVPAAPAMQDMGEGSMQVKGEGAKLLPLKRTEVRAEISGFVAEVLVTQVFANDSQKPIEAVYVFPLPENSAVNEMTLKVGDREIKGEIKKREDARAAYEQARAAGHTAALLDQERPNIFTQSVANIPGGKEIRVTLRYIQDLGYDHGVYKFNFPMTVGPRYIRGAAAGKTGTGWAEDTDVVPDASRITPPVVRPGQRSGRDISLTVRLNAGLEIRKLRSRSHDIDIKDLGNNSYEISLDEEDRIPNKDFLLTYEPAGKGVDSAVLAHKDGKDGYLTLMLQPAADFPLSHVTSKELVFALDVSGSMHGFPLEAAKETAMRFLEGMNPGDTFQIMTFASGSKLYFEKPLANTPENVERGRAVLGNLRGGGGTEMFEAIRTVMEFPKDPSRMRIVIFMTDGYIGDEAAILGFIKEHLNGSRIFPLGVGSSPNRYLLEEMAVMGKGKVEYVRQDARPPQVEKLIERFYERISRPVMSDIEVDWGGLEVEGQSPAVIGDLFAGQPVFVHARYSKGGTATVKLKGKMRGKPLALPVKVSLPEKEKGNAAMGPLWARSRITDLSREMYGSGADSAKEEITRLGLEHSLVTQFTSFVAVDKSSSVDGPPLLVPVESELPEGTRYEGFFGGRGSHGQAKSVPASGGAVAAVRGMFRSNDAALMSVGFASRSEAVAYAPSAKPAAEEKRQKAASRVEALASRLLAAPSRRLARQLVAMQDRTGVFTESDGSKALVADHALAVLALAKARSLYGSGLDEALEAAWRYLRDRSHENLDSRGVIEAALKGSAYQERADVKREMEALKEEMRRLK